MSDLAEAVQSAWRYRWHANTWTCQPTEVALETPVTLFVNGAEYVTAALTPTDLRDWAVGFLAGEGAIQQAREMTIFQWRPDEGQIWVRIPGFRPPERRASYLGSCCGQSRPNGLPAAQWSPLSCNLTWNLSDFYEAFSTLTRWSRTQRSGGLHVAGLARGHAPFLMRADVGRHNALDKVFGAALLALDDALHDAYLLFSGRLSAEIVWKARRMGVSTIVSNAAPTALGIEWAQSFGITLVGFLRDAEASVFSHPERLQLPALPPGD
ncbi:MAG: formate dehydrogenase accessory sulfurtransferase FdhD [Firmicutes bacterium]|nr:formate dehydrogenase accessory sulfurtransferase FdhD [Bacillota bacterium]